MIVDGSMECFRMVQIAILDLFNHIDDDDPKAFAQAPSAWSLGALAWQVWRLIDGWEN